MKQVLLKDWIMPEEKARGEPLGSSAMVRVSVLMTSLPSCVRGKSRRPSERDTEETLACARLR